MGLFRHNWEQPAPPAKNPKWCKRCSRYHPRKQPCDLVQVQRRTDSGEIVTRLVQRGESERTFTSGGRT